MLNFNFDYPFGATNSSYWRHHYHRAVHGDVIIGERQKCHCQNWPSLNFSSFIKLVLFNFFNTYTKYRLSWRLFPFKFDRFVRPDRSGFPWKWLRWKYFQEKLWKSRFWIESESCCRAKCWIEVMNKIKGQL